LNLLGGDWSLPLLSVSLAFYSTFDEEGKNISWVRLANIARAG
jgi:hypothetical protein